MILLILFFEFFKIGLFAIGGGMVTIPFLFDLSRNFDWFSAVELTNMIAVSQSTPGALGVNMATYAGFKAFGIYGGIVATLGLVLPSFIIVILVSRLLDKFYKNTLFHELICAIRPVVVALILFAGVELCRISIINYMQILMVLILAVIMYFYKKNPIFYIIISAILGLIFKL